jgi:hypothetical protein
MPWALIAAETGLLTLPSAALSDVAHPMNEPTQIAKISQPYSTLESLVIFVQHRDGMNV